MVKLFSQFNLPPRNSDISFEGELSMTQQQFKDESDINNIVDYNMRYKDPAFITKLTLAGKISQAQPIYGDFSEVQDYRHSLEVMEQAQKQFNALPAKVRARFNNNPADMLAFVENPDNALECVSLGLMQAKQTSLDIDKTNLEEAGVEPISGSVPETSAQDLT